MTSMHFQKQVMWCHKMTLEHCLEASYSIDVQSTAIRRRLATYS